MLNDEYRLRLRHYDAIAVDTLRDFPVISWAPGEAAYHPDCTGPLGIKFREGRARPIG